jgi:hypothetical protein
VTGRGKFRRRATTERTKDARETDLFDASELGGPPEAGGRAGSGIGLNRHPVRCERLPREQASCGSRVEADKQAVIEVEVGAGGEFEYHRLAGKVKVSAFEAGERAAV